MITEVFIEPLKLAVKTHRFQSDASMDRSLSLSDLFSVLFSLFLSLCAISISHFSLQLQHLVLIMTS